MAKLKAPLLSLGASQQLGKTMVFFPWKGLNVVREYVVPSNPKTAAQTTQRGYVSDAVAAIHTVMALGARALDTVDKIAYAAWANLSSTPRTWFNQAVKNYVDVSVAGDTPTVFHNGQTIAGANQLEVYVDSPQIDGADITAGKFYYGTSPTALLESEAAAFNAAVHFASATLAGLTTGVKYYWQFVVDAGENCEGAKSGIYYGTPT